ncbi:unnamed protein product, partial [marine sediment metagenome]
LSGVEPFPIEFWSRAFRLVHFDGRKRPTPK